MQLLGDITSDVTSADDKISKYEIKVEPGYRRVVLSCINAYISGAVISAHKIF